jgi:hypothetical protein
MRAAFGIALVAVMALAMDPRSGLAQDKQLRIWVYQENDGTTGTFTGTDGGKWTNVTGGNVAIAFNFVRRTTRFTELYDKSRNFTALLYDDGYSEWSVGKGWNRGSTGEWKDD